MPFILAKAIRRGGGGRGKKKGRGKVGGKKKGPSGLPQKCSGLHMSAQHIKIVRSRAGCSSNVYLSQKKKKGEEEGKGKMRGGKEEGTSTTLFEGTPPIAIHSVGGRREKKKKEERNDDAWSAHLSNPLWPI